MMSMLDSIKDENGQIKKPILISLIGGGGLLAYLMLKGGSSQAGGVSSTGLTTPLTPDLTGLQDALEQLKTGSGGGTTPPVDSSISIPKGEVPLPITPLPPKSKPTSPWPSPRPPRKLNEPTTTPPDVPGSSGNGGGGGGGTGNVIHPIAKTPAVYAGLTIPAPNLAAAKVPSIPTSILREKFKQTTTAKVPSIPTSILREKIKQTTTAKAPTRTSGGGRWATAKTIITKAIPKSIVSAKSKQTSTAKAPTKPAAKKTITVKPARGTTPTRT